MSNDFKITVPLSRDQREVMDKMTAAIRENSIKAVSFQLFKSLLIFPFSEDNDLFFLMERAYGLKGNGKKSFADLRVEAEAEANQLIADSLDRQVVTGPIEGAAMGNLLTQAMALGDIANLEELRQVVRNSEAVNVWEPHHTPAWEEAYQKLLTFLK